MKEDNQQNKTRVATQIFHLYRKKIKLQINQPKKEQGDNADKNKIQCY